MKTKVAAATAALACALTGAAYAPALSAGASLTFSEGEPQRWIYPRGGRDPLVPPRDLYTGQDLPEMEVLIVGYDTRRPSESMAVVRLATNPPVQSVVRPGDRVGAYRILGIGPRSIRVAAPTLGGSTVTDLSVRGSANSPSTW